MCVEWLNLTRNTVDAIFKFKVANDLVRMKLFPEQQCDINLEEFF